ncbi:MAG: sialidase family protein [Dokdonella sp.]
MKKSIRACAFCALVGLALGLGACGGGSSNSPTPPPPSPPPPPPSPPPTLDAQYRASAATPFAANCDGVAGQGTLFVDAEVEPSLAVNPADTRNLIGVWQQDRWSSGGARGIVAGVSLDGGVSWNRHAIAFTRCGGGTASNGGDYARASDPWVSISPDGTAYQSALAFNGFSLQPGSSGAVLASRSTDGGATWSAPVTLIHDGADFFSDKSTISADPLDARFVYAVWDRISTGSNGPTWFTRSIDHGDTWEIARAVYDPGVNNQTIANLIVVLPNGTLINMFDELHTAANGTSTSAIKVIRSTDNGVTWSGGIKVADSLSVGTRDPQTGAPVRDGSIVPQIAVGPGGSLFVVWQDSRFSNGVRDAIALSRSDDGGFTWSTPLRVNATTGVAAFTPSVHVRSDGMIGVTYYDFRADTADRTTLFTDYWLARSADAHTWVETQVAGPFNLAIAPLTDATGESGLFLGDYQALASIGPLFVPFYVQTNAGNLANRTDVFAAPAVSVAGGVSSMVSKLRAQAQQQTAAAPFVVTPEVTRRVSDNIVRAMENRLPGWHALMKRRPGREQP